MKDDFDRIRERIGIDKLDLTQRKKLFEDFVEHGGKVLNKRDERKGSKQEIARTLKQKTLPPLKGKRKIAQKIKTAQGSTGAKGVAKQKVETVREKRDQTKLLDLFQLYIRGMLYKVFTLKGKRFNDRFVDDLNKSIRDSFINLHLTVGSILKGENSIKREILHLSIGENSTFYEFLVRLNALYNEQEFNAISGSISESRTLPTTGYIDLFKRFFKKIYILGQYIDFCKLYIEKAVEIKGSRGRTRENIILRIKKQLKHDVNSVLGDFFYQFHIIVCKMSKTFYPLYSRRLEEFLEITEKDKIGYITELERKKRIERLKHPKRYTEKQKEVSTEGEAEDIKIPKHVEIGLNILDEAIRTFEETYVHGGNDPIMLMDANDKMYKGALLFEVFDSEYSFILTTSKIAFTIDYRDQKKIDIKEDLSHTYLLMNEAREDVNDYLEIIKEIKKAEENLRLTVHQKSFVLDSLSKKRSILSRSSRRKCADVMKQIENILSIVITDYNSTRRLLQNPDEILYFDKHVDGEKKLNGKKTIEAIVEAFLFSAALTFLLKLGELSGIGIYIDPTHQNE